MSKKLSRPGFFLKAEQNRKLTVVGDEKKKDAPTQPGNLQVTDSQTNTYLLELQLQITFTRNLKFLFLIHPRQY